MKPQIQIREFQEADEAQVVQWHRETVVGQPFDVGIPADKHDDRIRRVLRRIAAGAPGVVYCAEEAGQLVGTVCLDRYEYAGRQHGLIQLIYVSDRLRGSGLGKELLRRAVERSRALGFQEVEAFVSSGNVPSQLLFNRSGFSPTRIVYNVYLDPQLDRTAQSAEAQSERPNAV